MANLLNVLDEKIIVGDGAMGTLLQSRGVPISACLEELNISQPEMVQQVHEDYLAAGSQLIETNTFSANRPHLARYGLENQVAEINWKAVQLAKAVAKSRDAFVVGSVGPLALRAATDEGWTISDRENWYREQMGALLDGGVHAIFLETFSDLEEIRRALYVFRSLDSRPVLCSLACSEDGHLAGGETVWEAFQTLKEEGATLLGLNATLGPRAMTHLFGNLPLDLDVSYAAFPNAGKPKFLEGHYLFYAEPEYFASVAKELVQEGVRLIGGCIGTEPAHIAAVAEAVKGLQPVKIKKVVPAKIQVQKAESKIGKEKSPTLVDLYRKQTTVIVELDTPKSLAMKKFLAGAQALYEAGADAVTLADNSLAILRVGNSAAGVLLQEKGIRPLLHLSCRDRNVLGLESEVLGWSVLGLDHVLAITGDPAKGGDHPGASSVYDVNSVGLIKILAQMNEGKNSVGRDLKDKTRFVIGCSFNPNAKNFDSQIKKLESKLKAGATYVMTQPVFDLSLVKKTNELTRAFGVPVFVGAMPLIGSRNAEFLHNEVPGIVLTDEVRERMRGKEGVEGEKEGLKIAAEIQSEILNYFSGIYLITPLLRYEMSLALMSLIPKKCYPI
ncbi:MAG: bifunctional homocysteine S-methyltransferase/methylenetetrahydrofolate reductase [Verrucomicrobiia bacterium]